MSDKIRHRSEQQSVYAFYNVDELVHQQWPRLKDTEIGIYRTDFSKFCEAVQREYGVVREEIERCIELMRREMLYAA